MKMINDYCDHCNSQKTCVEVDNYDAEPVFNICFNCINYTLKLFGKDSNTYDNGANQLSKEEVIKRLADEAIYNQTGWSECKGETINQCYIDHIENLKNGIV